jgi:hypothetical protein
MPLFHKEHCAERHKATYERRGYSQSGENNNNWTGGIGTYRNKKKARICERCGSRKYMLIHHKDENRYNNDIENLEVLCKRCHQIEHNCGDNFPKGESLSALKKVQAAMAKRKNGRFAK